MSYNIPYQIFKFYIYISIRTQPQIYMPEKLTYFWCVFYILSNYMVILTAQTGCTLDVKVNISSITCTLFIDSFIQTANIEFYIKIPIQSSFCESKFLRWCKRVTSKYSAYGVFYWNLLRLAQLIIHVHYKT